jgi:hypothetical protein
VPTFSTRRGIHRESGRPVIEVLKEGEPWGATHGFDGNFRFGLLKAKMSVTAASISVSSLNLVAWGRTLPTLPPSGMSSFAANTATMIIS